MNRMVRDPLACVKEIYDHFGIKLTADVHRKMSRFMEQRDLSTRKPNIYRAEDYGLDIAALWPKFQYYRDFYGIEDNR
jgi:hypothetical protein